jgi:hypothetical protein
MKLQERRRPTKLKSFMLFARNIIILAIVFVGIGFYIAKQNIEPKIITEIKEKVITNNIGVSLETKIEELKNGLLDDLRTAEIQGYEDTEVIIVFDPRLKDLKNCQKIGGVRLHCYSFGDYNFKIATVQHYYDKFNKETIGEKQALEIALDKNKSRDLAYKVIFNEIGGIWNWKNSAEKINAAERISFIRSLEN